VTEAGNGAVLVDDHAHVLLFRAAISRRSSATFFGLGDEGGGDAGSRLRCGWRASASRTLRRSWGEGDAGDGLSSEVE